MLSSCKVAPCYVPSDTANDSYPKLSLTLHVVLLDFVISWQENVDFFSCISQFISDIGHLLMVSFLFLLWTEWWWLLPVFALSSVTCAINVFSLSLCHLACCISSLLTYFTFSCCPVELLELSRFIIILSTWYLPSYLFFHKDMHHFITI